MKTCSEKPSLLLVGNFLSASGRNPSVSEDLARRLQERSWSLVTTSSQTGRLSRLVDTLRTIWKRRREYQLAHVEVYSGLAFFLAEAACWMLRRAGRPYVLTLHGGNLPAYGRRWPGRVRQLLSSAVAVTAPSRYLQETMRAYHAEIRLIPNPLNVDRYEFRLRAQPAPKLIWLRAFNEVYNPAMAIRVLAKVRAQFPACELLMIGPDKGDGSLQKTQQLATELGVDDHVTFPGGIPKDEVASWLQRGDIFINTTNADNTPVSVLEAMACGLCVVTTNVGGLPYLVAHNETALLVPPDDDEAMSAAVLSVLATPGLAAKLSENGRREVEAFDWSQILPQWETLFSAFAPADAAV